MAERYFWDQDCCFHKYPPNRCGRDESFELFSGLAGAAA